jgi:hypothetical protein
MVRPSLVAFLDADGTDGPKVWFRSLLYNTSRKGNVVEAMFVRLRRGEAQQNFSFWVCGPRGELAGGCGLYVGHEGVALNHHFLLPKDGASLTSCRVTMLSRSLQHLRTIVRYGRLQKFLST